MIRNLRDLRTFIGLWIMHPKDRVTCTGAIQRVQRIAEWCAEQDRLSKGQSPTTAQVRAIIEGARVSRNEAS